MKNTFSSFLGANTPFGFVSFFDELYNPYEKGEMFIIKGGPGTGKSSIMKKIGKKAEEKGFNVEYVYCSSDPKSLDGIIIPEKEVAFADGTSPHILEPKFPGISETIINTGAFWNREELLKNETEIRHLTLENSLMHRKSSAYLSAAGKLNEENRRIQSRNTDIDKIYSFALRFVSRELKKTKKEPGKKMRRFFSAITPEGKIFLNDSVENLASRVIVVEDEYGAVSNLLIDSIGEMAVKNGYDVIFCYCPMSPKGECEHIIIPEVGLALLSGRKNHIPGIQYDRLIHSARFLKEDLGRYKKRLTLNKKIQNELIGSSVEYLKKAKEVHDSLERLYITAMNFESLGEYTQKLSDKIVNG